MSYAGPCTDDIGRMQGRIDDKLEAKAAAGPYAVESSRAQRSDQPTPRSMAATEERLGEISPQRLTPSGRLWRARVQPTLPVTRPHASRRLPMCKARSVAISEIIFLRPASLK